METLGHDGIGTMIDDLLMVDRLLAGLRVNLPLEAVTTPALAALLAEEHPGRVLSRRCRIDQAHYAGDDGGIVCRLEFGPGDSDLVYYVSITHLDIVRGQPMWREIEAYRKRRAKRLRRQWAA
jgi:glutamate/tyrosine decarboxylase-like PLP-dependent enzyme